MTKYADIPHNGRVADVCLVLEGSYPYVTGGVSSWAHSLLLAQQDLTFHLVCLLPAHGDMDVRYELPGNVISLTNILIDKPRRGPKSNRRFANPKPKRGANSNRRVGDPVPARSANSNRRIGDTKPRRGAKSILRRAHPAATHPIASKTPRQRRYSSIDESFHHGAILNGAPRSRASSAS